MPDPIKPWTIKNVSHEARSAATAAAKREGADIGEWMSRAILSAIAAERQQVRAVATLPPSAVVATGVEVSELAQLVAMATDLAGVSGGEVPKSVARLAWRAMRERLQPLRTPSRLAE